MLYHPVKVPALELTLLFGSTWAHCVWINEYQVYHAFVKTTKVHQSCEMVIKSHSSWKLIWIKVSPFWELTLDQGMHHNDKTKIQMKN